MKKGIEELSELFSWLYQSGHDCSILCVSICKEKYFNYTIFFPHPVVCFKKIYLDDDAFDTILTELDISLKPEPDGKFDDEKMYFLDAYDIKIKLEDYENYRSVGK